MQPGPTVNQVPPVTFFYSVASGNIHRAVIMFAGTLCSKVSLSQFGNTEYTL